MTLQNINYLEWIQVLIDKCILLIIDRFFLVLPKEKIELNSGILKHIKYQCDRNVKQR